MKTRRAVFLLSIFAAITASISLGQDNLDRLPSESPSVQATDTPPSFAHPAADKPIPVEWKLSIIGAVLLLSAALLFFAARAWRSWNLFDRQYRFPAVADPALRFGASRSGGCMATLSYGQDSTAEDA